MHVFSSFCRWQIEFSWNIAGVQKKLKTRSSSTFATWKESFIYSLTARYTNQKFISLSVYLFIIVTWYCCPPSSLYLTRAIIYCIQLMYCVMRCTSLTGALYQHYFSSTMHVVFKKSFPKLVNQRSGPLMCLWKDVLPQVYDLAFTVEILLR